MNSALLSDARTAEPNASLLMLIVDISSVATIVLLSFADIEELPSVTVSLDLITPFSISNLKLVVTFVKPSGAVISVSSYLPSFRPFSSASLPLKLTSLTLPSAEPPSIFTPSRSVSEVFSVNSALLSDARTAEPNASLLMEIVLISSRTVIVLPSAETSYSPFVEAFMRTALPPVTLKSKPLTISFL